MKPNAKKQGFSLVELLVSITAMAILVLIVGLLLIMPYRTMRTNREYAQLRRDVALAVRGMAMDIRKYSPSDIDVSDSNILLLNPNPGPPVRQKVEYIYNVGNQSLNRFVNNVDQGAIIEEGLILFTSSTNALEGVVLDISMQRGGGDVSLSLQTFIYTRN